MDKIWNSFEQIKLDTIGVGVTFSPSMINILSETAKWVRNHKARPVIIHIGEKTEEKETKLKEAFVLSGLQEFNPEMVWKDGDKVEAVNETVEEKGIDLMIAGALDKESLFKFYLGSPARNLGRKAKCNVLLVVDAAEHERPLKRIVVDAGELPKGQYAVNLANQIGLAFNTREIFLVKEVHHPALAMSMADNATAPEASKIKNELMDEEISYVDQLCQECDQEKMKVVAKTIQGKPGYAIAQFARTKKADLLIVNAPDKQFGILDRLFTHDLEYVLADLPCNVLIAKMREN